MGDLGERSGIDSWAERWSPHSDFFENSDPNNDESANDLEDEFSAHEEEYLKYAFTKKAEASERLITIYTRELEHYSALLPTIKKLRARAQSLTELKQPTFTHPVLEELDAFVKSNRLTPQFVDESNYFEIDIFKNRPERIVQALDRLAKTVGTLKQDLARIREPFDVQQALQASPNPTPDLLHKQREIAQHFTFPYDTSRYNKLQTTTALDVKRRYLERLVEAENDQVEYTEGLAERFEIETVKSEIAALENHLLEFKYGSTPTVESPPPQNLRPKLKPRNLDTADTIESPR